MSDKVVVNNANNGFGCLGAPLAFCLSLKTWGLTWWIILHTLGGWIYVIYWIVFYSGLIK